MSERINCATYNGIEGLMIQVEVDINRGLPMFTIVGLPTAAVKESKERVRSALINSGYEFPMGRITVNLSPADIKKQGALLDLAIAIGILKESNQISKEPIDDLLFLGELSLDGDIKRIRGTLSIILEGKKKGFKSFVIPQGNKIEGSFVEDVDVFTFNTLEEVLHFINYRDLKPFKDNFILENNGNILNFSDVIGQESALRGLEISAAGKHNIALYGPPGCGKSMLAKRFNSILPDMSRDEALEVTKVYSTAGFLEEDKLVTLRPIRSPHYTTSTISLIGGGSSLMPGEITLSHKGVLFLDELLEFDRRFLEALRQPLEDKFIDITRISGKVRYPCDFILLAAFNPCPCGYGTSSGNKCRCTDIEKKRYLSKLSGPLKERIDLYIGMKGVEVENLMDARGITSTEDIKEKVVKARKIQEERFTRDEIKCNSDMNIKLINKYCILSLEAKKDIKSYVKYYNLSARSYHRVLKVSRTIADLKGEENISSEDISESIRYRMGLDNKII